MSYCRWSTNDYRCDVYVYQSSEGWDTHVARHRHEVPDGAFPPPVDPSEDLDGWVLRSEVVRALIHEAERKPIGLRYDGESYVDATPGECADRLEQLRALGYRVPQSAIDSLRAEEV